MYDRLTASQNIRSASPTANSLPTDNQVDFDTEERETQVYAGNVVLEVKDDTGFEKIGKKVVESKQKNDANKNNKKKEIKSKIT